MENNLEKREVEQNAKKEWVSPEMQELNLTTGFEPGAEVKLYKPS
jgi:hypothetical protein